MWVLECKSAVVVHLNFRSDAHLAATMPGRGRGGREGWLSADGWERNTERQSTVSTGVPNGPYSGPVFSKAFEADSNPNPNPNPNPTLTLTLTLTLTPTLTPTPTLTRPSRPTPRCA